MKFEIEKRLHEIIRDLPECQKVERMLKAGYITTGDALKEILRAYEEEKKKSL